MNRATSPGGHVKTLVPAALLLASICPAQTQNDSTLVRADRIVVAPGVELEDSAILIRDGKVALVGPEIPDEAARNATTITFEGTLVPGFVTPHTHLSLGGDLSEQLTAATPELIAADAFDPFDERLLLHARHGVTAMVLAPLSTNTLAGVASAIRAGDIGEVIADRSYMKVALVPESLNQERFPTSRMGAAELIRDSFSSARSAIEPSLRDDAIRDVIAGTTRLAIHARSHAAITAALDLCEELNVTPLLIGADEAYRSLDRIAAAQGSVVLSPLRLDQPRRQLELPAKLEDAGIPFSFMATPPADQGAPSPGNPSHLRVSAAIAVRHGLSRQAALAALTQVPATQCGIGQQVGELRQGRHADFAIYSGDPIDLTSRLTAVFVGGQRVDMESER